MKKIETWLIVLAFVAYSLVAFTYMHSTFPTKDIFQMVCDKLNTIDDKIDRLIERSK